MNSDGLGKIIRWLILMNGFNFLLAVLKSIFGSLFQNKMISSRRGFVDWAFVITMWVVTAIVAVAVGTMLSGGSDEAPPQQPEGCGYYGSYESSAKEFCINNPPAELPNPPEGKTAEEFRESLLNYSFFAPSLEDPSLGDYYCGWCADEECSSLIEENGTILNCTELCVQNHEQEVECDPDCVYAYDCEECASVEGLIGYVFDELGICIETGSNKIGCEYYSTGKECVTPSGSPGNCTYGICNPSSPDEWAIRLWQGEKNSVENLALDWYVSCDRNPDTNIPEPAENSNGGYSCDFNLSKIAEEKGEQPPFLCKYEGDYYLQFRFYLMDDEKYFSINDSDVMNCDANGNCPYEGQFLFNVSYDENQTNCECFLGKEGVFNLGGEIRGCCGDDEYEFIVYRNASETMDNGFVTNLSDKACCDNKTDCVANNNCSSKGESSLDVDHDADLDVCFADPSGVGVWVDCVNNDQNSAQCGGDSSKSICDITSHECIEVNCNNDEDDDNDGDIDGADDDCRPYVSYAGKIGYCSVAMMKDGKEPCFLNETKGCVYDGEIVNDMLCNNGSWYSRQSIGFASLYPNREANFILKCDSLETFQPDDVFNNLDYTIDYSFYSSQHPKDIIDQCVQSSCYLASADEMTFLFNIYPNDTNCFRGSSPSYIFSNVEIDENFTSYSNSRESFEKISLANGDALYYNNYTKQLVYSNKTDLYLSISYSHDSEVLENLYNKLSGDPKEVLKNSSMILSLIHYDAGSFSIQGKNALMPTLDPENPFIYTVSVLYNGIPEEIEDFLADRFDYVCDSGLSGACGYSKISHLFYSSLLNDTKINNLFWPDYTSMLFLNIR
ncbi:MAG: hypothetical protein PWR30_247 [Candidatus Woesearchaeota archaeon]|nr:hypothetical protein [Candidatus Woesearchaeota archaeon]